MHLPAEIRDEIVSHLLFIEPDPWYSQSTFNDMWIDLEDDEDDDDEEEEEDDDDDQVKEYIETFARQDPLYGNLLFRLRVELDYLLPLRLVSHEWYNTVTIVLREHHWRSFSFDCDHRESLESFVAACEPRKDLGPNSKLPPSAAHMVRKLDIWEIKDVRTFDRKHPPEIDVDRPMEEYQESCDVLEEEVIADIPAQAHYDKTDHHRLLRKLFDSLQQIEAFSISFPAARVEYNSEISCSYANCYDIRGIDEIAATVGYGLRSTAFEHLVDLRLEIPSTRDVERFVGTMSRDSRDRLKSLYIRIQDQTGDGGDDEEDYGYSGDPNDAMFDGTDMPGNVPASNLQMAFPNRKHQDGLWKFISSCPKLENLSITGTHYLDLDQFRWEKPSASPGFCKLSLERVWTSIPSLINMLSPASASAGPPQLRAINLYSVKVRPDGGSWSQFFTYLRDMCPKLECSRLYELTYFSAHENYRWNHRFSENIDDIWTISHEDKAEMKSLALHLYKKAGGREKYP